MSIISSSRSARTMQRAVLVTVALASTACASFSRKEQGAAIGAAAGAAVGGVIGNNTGSTARGAIIGAVMGGAAGAIIGHQMDQQAKELTLEIPGATVARVGEGIQVTFDSGLLYDAYSHDIRPEAAENLRNLATSLKKYPNTELLIVGHSDNPGSTDYNLELSKRRANAASEYLSQQGVGANRIHTSGKGEWEPVASNETESGRQMNRRIEVAIYAGELARGSSAAQASTVATPAPVITAIPAPAAGPRRAPAPIITSLQASPLDLSQPQGGRSVGAGSDIAMMGTGAAAVVVGLLVGGESGTIISFTGGVVGLVGLYRYLR